MKKNMIMKIISFTVIFCMIGQIVLATTESEKKQLENQKSQANQELKEIKEDKKVANSQLEKINDQISDIQDEIAALKSKISDLNAQINDKEQEIKNDEKKIEEKDKLLKARMVALYEAGDISYLDVLLNSESIIDFISGYSAIQTILETDTELINSLEAEKTKLEEDKVSLSEAKVNVENSKKEQEIKNATLVGLQKDKEKEVSNLTAEEKAKQAEIDKYTAAIAEAEAKIAKEAAAAKKKAEEAAKKNSGSSSSSSAGSVNNSSGRLGWPLPASYQSYYWITSYFGPRVQPTAGASTNHGAIDIGVRYQPVYAAESGVVLIAQYVSGYGNFIMIWHKSKGELYTCYGHLSQFNVSAGATVSRGQQIAVSGNTGVSTGPHLHFEVRDGGDGKGYRRDPLNYLSL